MIYIIRHGKTELNRANVLPGRSDHPLNEEGILQAKKASEKMRSVSFDHVFSSPLIRALQTAEIIVPVFMVTGTRSVYQPGSAQRQWCR